MIANTIERATPGEKVVGSIPAPRPLPTGWVGVSTTWTAETEVMVFNKQKNNKQIKPTL